MRLVRALVVFVLGFAGAAAAAAAVLKRALPSHGDADSDEVALVAVFDGVTLKSRASAFKGGSMLSWFGGIAVDFREATLAPDAQLRVHALFGGIALRVPTGWRVVSNVNALGGGVAIDVPDPDDPDAPTLTLEGLAAFGGVAVKAKPSETPEI